MLNTPEELFALGRYSENLIGANVTLGTFYDSKRNKHILVIFDSDGKIAKQILLEEIIEEYGVEKV